MVLKVKSIVIILAIILLSCRKDPEPEVPMADLNMINLLLRDRVYQFTVVQASFNPHNNYLVNMRATGTGRYPFDSLFISFYGANFESGKSYSNSSPSFGSRLGMFDDDGSYELNADSDPMSGHHDVNGNYRLEVISFVTDNNPVALDTSLLFKEFKATFEMRGYSINRYDGSMGNFSIKGSVNIFN